MIELALRPGAVFRTRVAMDPTASTWLRHFEAVGLVAG
jgi:hypothetical protein